MHGKTVKKQKYLFMVNVIYLDNKSIKKERNIIAKSLTKPQPSCL